MSNVEFSLQKNKMLCLWISRLITVNLKNADILSSVVNILPFSHCVSSSCVIVTIVNFTYRLYDVSGNKKKANLI